jgi:hypothetical protein
MPDGTLDLDGFPRRPFEKEILMKPTPALVLLLFASTTAQAADPVEIGSRRELFVDDALVERLVGRAELRLQHPEPREVALVTGEPWEGNGTNYVTVFQGKRLESGWEISYNRAFR